MNIYDRSYACLHCTYRTCDMQQLLKNTVSDSDNQCNGKLLYWENTILLLPLLLSLATAKKKVNLWYYENVTTIWRCLLISGTAFSMTAALWHAVSILCKQIWYCSWKTSSRCNCWSHSLCITHAWSQQHIAKVREITQHKKDVHSVSNHVYYIACLLPTT